MKHAYLIIAHNEFAVLQQLIDALDDARNDIYVHIDKKVAQMPTLSAKRSGLFILNQRQRVAVYWGHVSQIKAEYALFHAALRGGTYSYYHIVSGTHLPLKTQDFIHRFFAQQAGYEVMQPMESTIQEVRLKIHLKNFFLKYFKHSNPMLSRMAQITWRRLNLLQSKLGMGLNKNQDFIKAANWVSLTHEGVSYLIENEQNILKKYKRSFCGDEYFVPSELALSPHKEKCLFYPFLMYSHIQKDTARLIGKEECVELLQTDFLFARKFGAAQIETVHEVMKHLKKMS